MDNIEENDNEIDSVIFIGKTIKINDDNYSTSLIIPKEISEELDIENSKV
ncbi:MAG: hypothetical protein H0X50_06035, partial [Nitrosopumilus sp.]|nr:hypothetical protein [Nitrosopumilus sp.]